MRFSILLAAAVVTSVVSISAFAQALDPQVPNFTSCHTQRDVVLQIKRGQLVLTTQLGETITARLTNPRITSEPILSGDGLQQEGAQAVFTYTNGPLQVRLASTQNKIYPNQYSVIIVKNGANVLQGYCYVP